MEQAQQQIVLPNITMDDVSAMLGESEVKIKMRDKALERLAAENTQLAAQNAQLAAELDAARQGLTSENELQRVRTLTEQTRALQEQNATLEHIAEEQRVLLRSLKGTTDEGVTEDAEASGISHNETNPPKRAGARAR